MIGAAWRRYNVLPIPMRGNEDPVSDIDAEQIKQVTNPHEG